MTNQRYTDMQAGDMLQALGSTVTLRKRGARTIWREAGRAAA